MTDFSSDGRLAFDDMGLERFAQMSIENSHCSGETVEIPEDERFATIGEPHWSPDAAWIAFGAEDGIWIVHPDGNELRKLPGTEQLDEADWRAVPENG